jgi:hypothetical protein
VYENVQLVERRQGNDGFRDEASLKGCRVAHPRGNQCLDHRRRQHAVVLNPLKGLGPIDDDGVASQRMKGIVDHHLLGLVMGSMQGLRSPVPPRSSTISVVIRIASP